MRYVINEIRHEVKQSQSVLCNELFTKLPASLQRSMEVATWLSMLPIQEHGFALHKGAFRDAFCLRYGWQPNLLPSTCVCGKTFSVEHALNCPCGGYPSIRHNELQDITATLLTEVCHSVGTEPGLQPLSGEFLKYKTANDADDARVDIVTENFWCRNRRKSYLDVKVFNPFAKSYVKESLTQCYRCLELYKKRARVHEVELGCFTPLVFSTSGGFCPAAKTLEACITYCRKAIQLNPFLASCQIELFIATFCNHVSSWLKIILPSRRMLPTRLCHRSVLLSRQKCLMFCLYALMFVNIC